MATTNVRFVAKNGLDNNSNSITNLGATGASLALSGANALTLTTSGATNVTLPTSGTLATTAGNVATATTLATARNINGVSFNGSADITVTAAAGTLTGVVAVTAGGTGLSAVGTSGNVLTSNGTVWVSSPATGGGGGGGLTATVVQTSAYTALVNDLVRVDSTSGVFTVTLPSSPADGDKVGLLDVTNKCQINPVLIAAAGGKTVEFDATGLSANTSGANPTLIYNSYNTNWKLL